MIQVGDLVEDDAYEGYYGYVVGVVNLRIPARHRGEADRFVRNCHIKFFNDTDEDTVVIEADRLTRIG